MYHYSYRVGEYFNTEKYNLVLYEHELSNKIILFFGNVIIYC